MPAGGARPAPGAVRLNTTSAIRGGRDDEPAAAGVSFTEQFKARRGVLRTLDDHMLDQSAEARFDRAFVARIDLEVVGDRALLTDVAVGLGQHRAGAIAVSGPRRVELLEGQEARLQRGQLLLARSNRARAPVVLDVRAGQLGFTRRSGDARGVHRLVQLPQPFRRLCAINLHAVGFDADVVSLDVQLRQRLGHPVAGGPRVLQGMAQRRGGIDGGEHFTARRLDVRLEAFDFAMHDVVGRTAVRERLPGTIAIDHAPRRRASRRACSATRAGSRRASSVSISAVSTAARASSD